jgi:hypothetical protein
MAADPTTSEHAMPTRKPSPRVAGQPQPATTDKTQGPAKSAVKDRKASTGNRYSEVDAPTAEGNDPSLVAGRTVVRKVPDKKR